MEPVQSLAQCFGSACGSSVIINGPTPSKRYEDLAEPSGMPFKVAACFFVLYAGKHSICFDSDALVNANSMLVTLAFTDRPQSAVVTGS